MRVPWKLSFRQPPGCWFEIIRGIVDEQKDRTIAASLGISTHTVRTQLDRMFRMILGGGVHTRTGVVVCAFEAFIRMRQLEATTNTHR